MTFSFSNKCSAELCEIDERLANGSVGVVEIVEEFAECAGVEADGLDTDVIESGDDGFDAVVQFVDSFVIDVAIDAGDAGGFVFAEGAEKVFGLFDGAFHIDGTIIWNHDKERFVHNVGFAREGVNEVDVIIHEDTEKHVVVVAAKTDEMVDIGSEIDTLRADKDLDGEVERVEKVLITIFDAFTFDIGHKVEVDGLAGDDGAEGAIFHDNNTVAKFGEHESGLGGERILGDLGRFGYGRRSGGLILRLIKGASILGLGSSWV